MSDATTPGLRLAIEHLRLEGTGPMLAARLAGRIERHLERLIATWGMPESLAGRGALRLEGARIQVQRGASEAEIAAAIARQLFERWYGPLPPWARPAAGPATSPMDFVDADDEENRR